MNIYDRFRSALADGFDKICEAASIYVDAIDNHGLKPEQFREQFPEIPAGIFAGLEAVGRGVMDKRLLWGGGRAAPFLRKLPISEQRAALDAGVQVITEAGDSRIIPAIRMTACQCEIAFSKDHIRSLPEQAAQLEDMKRRIKAMSLEEVEVEFPYEVKGNKLIINRPLTLTKADVKRLLGMMT